MGLAATGAKLRLDCVPHYMEVFTDALLIGWGGTSGRFTMGRAWELLLAHIDVLERLAVQRVLLHFAQPGTETCNGQVGQCDGCGLPEQTGSDQVLPPSLLDSGHAASILAVFVAAITTGH